MEVRTKLYYLVALGIAITTVGIKLYDKQNTSEPKTAMENPKLAHTEFSEKTNNKVCMETFDDNKISFEALIARHEAFVHRHLHKNTSKHEMFLTIATNQFKLIKYRRCDTKPEEVQTLFLFEPRPERMDQSCCRVSCRITFKKSDQGRTQRWLNIQCHPRTKTKTSEAEKPSPTFSLFPITAGYAIVVCISIGVLSAVRYYLKMRKDAPDNKLTDEVAKVVNTSAHNEQTDLSSKEASFEFVN